MESKIAIDVNEIKTRYKILIHKKSKNKNYITDLKNLLLEIRSSGKHLSDSVIRSEFLGMARNIGKLIFELTDEYYPIQLELQAPTLEDNVSLMTIQQSVPWQPRWEPPSDEAQDLLDGLLAPEVPPTSPLPAGARMPFAPNPQFVGRDDMLLALAQALHGGARVVIGPKAAATGLGGIGKTSVAAEFVHRYGTFFAGGVFWLSFADPAAIPSEVAACGGTGALGLHPTYGELKQDEQLALVREAWQRPIPRLLIFDNVEDPQLIQQWAPPSGGCRVLITSRRQTWPASLDVMAHRLDVLTRAASVALLRNLAPRLTSEEANDLAEELGDFPLALQLAGSYLAQFGRISVDSYLSELRGDVILAHPSLRGVHDGDVSTTAHDRHVGRTFLVSYQRLDPSRDTLALALLVRAACLAPGTPIPIDLLLASAGLAPEDAAGQMALGRLADLGFVTLRDEGVVLHRLVHAFVGGIVQDAEALEAVEETLITRSFAINAAGYPALMAPLLPHLMWATRAQTSRQDSAIAALCANLGHHWKAMGAYAQAQPLYERALAIREQVLGPDHPDTAASLNDLAGLYDARGAYAQAQSLYERALAIREQVLGPDHPDTAASLNDLAGLYDAKGAYVQAQTLYERALAIRERVLGPDHPDMARSLNNLALLYRAMGAYAEALPLPERALAIQERILGPDHPDTAVSLTNLALLYDATGASEQALPLLERALAIRERVLGPDHPETAASLNNLALLYHATGAPKQALPLLERALAIRERVLGPNHPETAYSLNNLALLYRATGAPKKALPLLKRALIICKRSLGPSHSTTTMIRTTLNDFLSKPKGTK